MNAAIPSATARAVNPRSTSTHDFGNSITTRGQ